jgi:hypothetical protein
MQRIPAFCDGLHRRDLLRIGTAGLFGLPLTLPGILRGTSHGKESANESARKPESDVSVILLFLKGGLSTIDTFDLKPNAPAEFRGEFNSIDTIVPGIRIGEHLPRIAQQMDKFSLIRSFTHRNSDHGPADHYMITGYHPAAGFNPNLKPNNQRPAHGSIIAHKLGPRGSVPPYVCLPRVHSSAGSAYLGSSAAPFVVEADPNDPNFAVPDLAPPFEIESSRLNSRKDLLSRVDKYQRGGELQANRAAGAVSTFQRKAFELMTSSATKAAFDIHQETDKLRDEYGRNSLGQSVLMARRLVEAGVRCVMIDHTNWDTHYGNFASLKNDLLPLLDSGLSTLFRDLSDRGRLGSTMVVVTGEFGRTPRINKDAGRDHWGPGFTVLVGGGGVRGGLVVGKSDARAEKPDGPSHGPEDLAATIYHLLGMNPKEEFYTPEGRPVPIVNGGHVITELL